jgi:sulfite exporter TauE/SafE
VVTGLDQLAAAFLVGLLGGVHCVGMCAGIVGTLTMALPPGSRARPGLLAIYQLAYNVGRLSGYALAGALMGGVGQLAVAVMPVQYAQRALYAVAAVFMILVGLYLGGWWPAIERLERLGGLLWRRLEPVGRRLLPVRSVGRAAAVGLVWAWIPCGLVYSVLVWSVSAGNAANGALLMLAFGLGTLPTLMGLGLLAGAAARVTGQTWVRRLAGALVTGFGLYALWQLFLVQPPAASAG